MTILINHKIRTYLLKAHRDDDLVAKHKSIMETKAFLADLEKDSRAELIHYGLAEMAEMTYTPMPTKAVLEAKFGKAFLKLFKNKTKKVFRILG
tara:strand:+ start:257 stop:538 length:282 start_codon:yes stop_codon:yes gene_type:complete